MGATALATGGGCGKSTSAQVDNTGIHGGRNIMMPILGGGGKGDDGDDHPFPVQQKYEWPKERGKIKFFSSTRGV